MIVLPDSVDSTIVSSFIWTKHRNVTDGRRTDRSAVAITAVCIASSGGIKKKKQQGTTSRRRDRDVALCINVFNVFIAIKTLTAEHACH